jgi:hypothetical protein
VLSSQRERRCCLGILPLCLMQPLAKAKRLAKEFEDVRSVNEAIQQRAGHAFVSQHVIPVPKVQVRGDNHLCWLLGSSVLNNSF